MRSSWPCSQPGDTILGMSLDAGGHLTHGAKPAMSGKWFKAVQYGVRAEDGLIDFDQVERLAHEHKPKLIIAGASAYSRFIDFARFRAIADAVGAWFLVDMAHIAGLVAAGVHPSPMPHAHVVTTTTHKTLRGPRGGMILTNDEDLGKKINSAVFPGLQGGPLMHVIAAKAVAFGEALRPEFKLYAQNVVANAKALAAVMIERGCAIVSGGTDNHLMLVDLRPKGVKGNAAAEALERAGITCNKNGVPFDPEKPTVTSGIRLGTPAGTTRGFGVKEFQDIGHLISDVLDGLAARRHRRGRAQGQGARRRAVRPVPDLRLRRAGSGRRPPAIWASNSSRRERTSSPMPLPAASAQGNLPFRKAQPRMASGSPPGSWSDSAVDGESRSQSVNSRRRSALSRTLPRSLLRQNIRASSEAVTSLITISPSSVPARYSSADFRAASSWASASR